MPLAHIDIDAMDGLKPRAGGRNKGRLRAKPGHLPGLATMEFPVKSTPKTKGKSKRFKGRNGLTPVPDSISTFDEEDGMECEAIPEVEPNDKQAYIASQQKKEPETEEERILARIVETCGKVRHGHYSEVKHLIQKEGVPVDATDEHGNSLLVLACQNNQKKIVKFLIKNGANVRAQNQNGFDAFHYAQLYQFKDLFPYLKLDDRTKALLLDK